jgi:F-type H+-transporting ATPase subunit b
VLAQETAKAETTEQNSSSDSTWKIVNFAIFAAALGFALVKYAPGFFNTRTADIQKAIKDATGLKMDADFRYSEVDKKMANLAGEVNKLRDQSKAEMEREHQRLLAQTQDELDYIKKGTAAEVDALRLEAVSHVRRHAAQLAFGLAEQRLRDRFAAADQQDLMHDFVNLVERGKN